MCRRCRAPRAIRRPVRRVARTLRVFAFTLLAPFAWIGDLLEAFLVDFVGLDEATAMLWVRRLMLSFMLPVGGAMIAHVMWHAEAEKPAFLDSVRHHNIELQYGWLTLCRAAFAAVWVLLLVCLIA